VSKLRVSVPEFRAARSEEDEAKFLTRLELEAENVVGSYGCAKHVAY
jgi:hypothetical protein